MDSEKLTGKRVLVTGGKGFLGSYLVAALEKTGAEVFVIDNRNITGKNDFEVDITDEREVKKIIAEMNPQMVYHLASSLNRNRDFSVHGQVMSINYFATLNLLNSLKETDCQNFIFASTSEIYGNNKPPFHEEQLPDPASPYSLSKVFAEQTIRTFSRLHGKNFTILRLFNFFGKNMPADLFIPQLVNALLAGEMFKMTKGAQARDFLHAEDVVQALLLAGTNKNAYNEVFNVCSGESTTLRGLVTKFNERTGNKGKIAFGTIPYRENEIWDMAGSNRKISENLGFSVQYSIDLAIDKLISEW